MSYLEIKVIEITEPEFIHLMEELKEVTHVDPLTFENAQFFHYLTQCVFPNGSHQRIPLRRDELTGQGYLSSTLRKLRTAAPRIYDLCHELARKRGSSAEANEGRSLFSFLNAFLPEGKGGKMHTRRRLL